MQHSLCTQTNTITSAWTQSSNSFLLITTAQTAVLRVNDCPVYLGIEYDCPPSLVARHRDALRQVRWLSAVGVLNRLEQAVAA